MSNQLIRQGIRLRADERSREPMLDAYTNATPQGWTRAATQFEVALARGGSLVDVGNLASVTLEGTLYADKDGPRVFSRTLAGADLQPALTEATWTDGTAQHALFVFSNAEMNIDLQGADSADFWLVITALTQEGDGIVCGTGRLTICDDGAFLATPPPPAYPGAGITIDQADTRYARLGAGAGSDFLPDVDEAIGTPTSLDAVPVSGLRPGVVRRMKFTQNVDGFFGPGITEVLATYQLVEGLGGMAPDTILTPGGVLGWRLVFCVADNGDTILPGGVVLRPDATLGIGGLYGGFLKMDYAQGSGINLSNQGGGIFTNNNGGSIRTNGHGSPENTVPAPVGSLYCNQDGNAGSGVLYVKEAGGGGSTGWNAVGRVDGKAVNPASIGAATPGTARFTTLFSGSGAAGYSNDATNELKAPAGKSPLALVGGNADLLIYRDNDSGASGALALGWSKPGASSSGGAVVGHLYTLSTSDWMPWITVTPGGSFGQYPMTAFRQVQVTHGDLEVTDPGRGVILRAPNNARWRVQVGNGGALTVTAVP